MCAGLYDTLTMQVEDRERERQKAELEARKLACPRDASMGFFLSTLLVGDYIGSSG